MRMPWRVQCESISGEQNSLVEVIYPPEQIVPSAEMDSEVVQRLGPIRMPWQVQCESISVQQNSLVEVVYPPEQIVPSAEMASEVVQ